MMNKSSGFTLIEVLIAMLVFALGLLGLAGLQARGMRNNLSSYHRTQATQLAYDMADRMRANPDEVGAGAASAYITQDPATATAQADCVTVSTTCTTADMAVNDLFQWNQDISNILPGGSGAIAASGAVFSITINWDDNRDGIVDSDSTNAIPDDPNFQVSFQL